MARTKTSSSSSPSTSSQEQSAHEQSSQETTQEVTFSFFFPRLSFARLLNEITLQFSDSLTLEADAIDTLQEVAERHLLSFFKDLARGAAHDKRVTIMKKDVVFAKQFGKYGAQSERA